jgi:hypothetical protein
MVPPASVGSEEEPASTVSESVVRSVLGFTLLLTVAALVQLFLTARQTGVLSISQKWQAALTLGALVALAEGTLLVLAGDRRITRLRTAARARIEALLHRKALCALLVAVLVPLFPAAVFGPFGRYVEGLFPRLLFFWIVVLLLTTLLRSWLRSARWPLLLLGTALIYGLIYQVLLFVPGVSAFPFSLDWSEASRYYYASLFWSEGIYGFRVNPPELHPTRYLLQSIPFLIRSLPLWFHRLWQVVLWLALPAAVAALWIWRLQLKGRWFRLLFGAWVVLFLFQGPVYYHLLVMVAVVLAGVDVRRPWRSSAAVALASIWAGISRVNWFPVPALLAGCLYLLARRTAPGERPTSLRWPLAWLVAGPLIALASQALYIQSSGIPAQRFASSFSSQILFYRLFPNATYPPGLLAAILLASAPMALTLWRSRPTWMPSLNAGSRVFLAAALALLFSGGLLVSLKIGGGSNLHNLDAYLVLLMMVGSALVLGRPTEGEAAPQALARLPAFGLAAFLAAIPIVFALGEGRPWVHRDPLLATESLDVVREEAQKAVQQGERVLFISQRHLTTFGMVTSVPLEPEYETVFLMEMAMAGNRTYLDAFHTSLQQHEFGLIVVDRLSTAFQGRGHGFGEENDAWVREVSLPVLCWYEPSLRLDVPRLDFLVPKSEGAGCPEGS